MTGGWYFVNLETKEIKNLMDEESDNDSNVDFILPDSSNRYLTDQDLQSYFDSCSWYVNEHKSSRKVEKELSEIEKANIQFLKNYEDNYYS